jgi:ribokinase
MARRTRVFGPAYLDRVLHVDRPLIDPAEGTPLDQSVDGSWKFGAGLLLVDPTGACVEVELPKDWPGPTGQVELSHPLFPRGDGWRRAVKGISWHDDLGGMGSGFAAAFGGELTSALGPDDDPTSLAISERLLRHGITHRPIRVTGQSADWTLLVTSGEYGDKLPIGFRGCHAALAALGRDAAAACDLRVVAALPNRLAAEALNAPNAAVRFFAPALRNMLDRQFPVARFADAIDILSCNRHEWENLADREQVAWQVSVLAITDGPRGSTVRFTTPSGEPGSVTVDAFPRDDAPGDTNRAGEAYAATLVTSLLDGGWATGVVDESLVRMAAQRAAAAAALVIDRMDFGFPTREEINGALRAGRIAARPRDARGGLR